MPHEHPRMRLLAGALTAILALCTDARHLSPQQSFSVTDSAGIRIVENSEPAWSAGAGWRLGTEPTLTIGAVTGDLNYLFQGISHVLRLEDGTVVVADRGANELRLFDAAGGFIRSLGGPGEGPGEFQLLNEVWTRGDTILVSDNIQSRISVFGRGGDVLETIPVEVAPGRGSRSPKSEFADGSLLVLNAPTGGIGLGTGDVIAGAVWRPATPPGQSREHQQHHAPCAAPYTSSHRLHSDGFPVNSGFGSVNRRDQVTGAPAEPDRPRAPVHETG